MQTDFTRLVGCQHPLQQAAMGGVATPELAGAVARAGALGMLCEYAAEPAGERMTRALGLAGAAGTVGMGFFGFQIDSDLNTFELAASRLRVVEVFWSQPDAALVARARRSGSALVAWQVGSVAEAAAAADAGCDFVVAQGVEAGGHVRGTIPRAELLRSLLGRLSVPIVTAGGIAAAGDVAAAISAGAAAVRVGTRFVAAVESSAHPDYVAALLAAQSGEETVVTTAFSGGWPDAPHRVLRSAVERAMSYPGDAVGFVVEQGRRRPVERFSVSTPHRDVVGEISAMALYAGTGVGAVTAIQPAADVVADLVSGLTAG